MSDESERLYQIRLPGRREPRVWRGVAEFEAAEAMRQGAREPGEFPPGVSSPPDTPEGVSRRGFLQLLGASMALAGVSGCTRDQPEKVLPYTTRPREVTPGVPLWYATSMVLDGYATGLLVESHEGRPTKIEGHPEHPASLGATGVFEQASVLQLYDPERARAVKLGHQPGSWGALAARLGRPRDDGGAGLRFVLEPTSSPLVLSLLGRIRERYPAARFCFYSPLGPASLGGHAAVMGTLEAFGRPLQPQYDVSRADVILSLEADFLAGMPFHIRYARQFAARRRVARPTDRMNRLYVVESMLSPTGSMADHRLARRPSDVWRLAAAVAAALPGMPPAVQAVLAQAGAQAALAAVAPGDGGEDWARVVARDLGRHPGASLVIAGERQPAAVHALAYMMNAALGNLGRTVKLTEPVLGLPEGSQDLAALVAEMRAGAVDTLILLESNPCYTAPAELEFARWLGRVKDSVCLALYQNETGRSCRWFAPAAHYLESWGDARAYDGTLSIVQPLVRPLFGREGGRTPAEVLAMVLGEAAPDGYSLLREAWNASSAEGERAAGPWEEALALGFVRGSALPEVTAGLRWDEALKAVRRGPAATGGTGRPVHDQGGRGAQGAGLEIAFQRSPTLHDGRFANNAWLQELPLPITKLTWGNAAFLSRTTARRLGVEDEQVLEIQRGGRKVWIPALIVPGHADGAITLLLGYGREGAETLAAGHGVNVYPLRTSEALSFALDGVVRPAPKTGLVKERSSLARTQVHWSMYGRPIALAATLEEYRREPDFTAEHKGKLPSLLPEDHYEGLQWAMSIDLSICTGCSACMVACQAENNVPVVGKEEVRKSREMHWLRIDTYFTGAVEAPGVVHQPMLCQHCEKAPCEYVCPVNATVHSPDGLNEMVYNRCVGTRFCSNNCPYKVRRFNWFDYGERSAAEPNPNRGPVELQHNPDVTVRERGVMEKCTYCVQRIRQAEIQAQIEGRAVRPGEVVTACQQACPTRAIQFDSLSHKDTEMVRWRSEPRSYAVLHDQGTEPRTMYLARINNPNPELK